MKEIAPGIFVENTYAPYNLGLIQLDAGALAVDVPPSPSQAQQWLQQATDAVGDLRYLVLTDAQADRIIGAASWNIPIIAAQATLRFIMELEANEKSWQSLLSSVLEHYPEEAEALETLRPRRINLATDNRLTLHQRAAPLILETSIGAAPGSLWVYVQDEELLFVGDSVAINTPPLLTQTTDSKAWLNKLGQLAKRKTIQKIVPGRGPHSILRAELETQREFLRVARRTARGLARKDNWENGAGLAQAATELQQIFFPSASKKSGIPRQLRQGLEHLVIEIKAAEAKVQTETEEQAQE